MFLFIIKKTFFDMWDNLFRIFIINIGFLILTAGFIYLVYLAKINNILLIIVSTAAFIAIQFYTGAVTFFIKDIADYKKPGFAEFYEGLKKTILPSLFFSAVFIVFIFLISISFPFYSSFKNIIGVLLFSLLFWISFIFLISIMYYYPILSRLDSRILKVFKKSFLIFFDNPGFSLLMVIGSIIIIVLSLFVGFLIPGFGTLLLWWNVGLKLRLYKYDYLEKFPETIRKKIPWRRLIARDYEMVGKRSLKGLIFPWKE